MRRTQSIAAVLVLLSLCWIPRVEAATAADPVRKLAVDSYRKGLGLYRKKQYAKALLLFQTAHRLVPRTRRAKQTRLALQFFSARCFYQLKRYAEARDGFKAYLVDGGNGEWLRESRDTLKRIKELLGRTGTGGKAATKVPSKPKPRSAGGQQPAAGPGTTKQAAAPPGTGAVGAATKARKPKVVAAVAPRKRPPAGKARRPVPPVGPKTPGKGAPTPPPGKRVSLKPTRLPPPGSVPAPPRRPGPLPWIVAGTGAAAMAAGAVFLVLGRSAKGARDQKKSEADGRARTTQDTEEIASLHSSAQTRFAVGWAALGTGTAIAAAGTLLWLLQGRSGPTRGETVAALPRLSVSPEGAVVTMGGRI